MFWRFLVAGQFKCQARLEELTLIDLCSVDDPEVQRYIVRDTDSRLNARERFAVEEWITSGRKVLFVGRRNKPPLTPK